MHPLFLEWALEHLDKEKKIEKNKNKKIELGVSKKVKEIETQISGINRMRARDLLDDTEYLKEKQGLTNQLSKLQNKNDDKASSDKIIELTKETYIFCAYALKKYTEGDDRTKKEVLANLGSNRVIEGKKVLISVHKWLAPIFEMTKLHNTKLARLEPMKFGYDYNKNEALNELRTSWLPRWNDLRTVLAVLR